MARRRRRSSSSSRWGRYVPVAERRAKSQRQMEKLGEKGLEVQPVYIEGRKIAKSFWGESWCDHLESFSDYANRLPRGRTYVRNGSVCHLKIHNGLIQAKVMGSSLYDIRVLIQPLDSKRWKQIKKRCAGQIASLLELLQGSLSDAVMEIVTDRHQGLFPEPQEIELSCDCPDWADLCKHLAAVLYGVGARLDENPELLFLLRGVDHHELVVQDADSVMEGSQPSQSRRLEEEDLSAIFGLEILEDTATSTPRHPTSKKKSARKRATTTKKVATTSRRAKSIPAAKRRASTQRLPARTATTHKNKPRTRPQSPERTQPIKGRYIRDLRLWLGMSRQQFAQIVTVSPATISNWESQPSPRLQDRTEKALRAASRLSKKKAWEQLDTP